MKLRSTDMQVYFCQWKDKDGSDRHANVDVNATGYLEKHYGADADGNRGTPEWFLESWSIECPDEDICGQSITELDRQLIKEIVDDNVCDIAFDWETHE